MMDLAAIILFWNKDISVMVQVQPPNNRIPFKALKVEVTLARKRGEWRCSKQRHLPNVKRREVYLSALVEKVTI